MKLSLVLSQKHKEFTLRVVELKKNQLGFVLEAEGEESTTFEVYGNVVIPHKESRQ